MHAKNQTNTSTLPCRYVVGDTFDIMGGKHSLEHLVILS